VETSVSTCGPFSASTQLCDQRRVEELFLLFQLGSSWVDVPYTGPLKNLCHARVNNLLRYRPWRCLMLSFSEEKFSVRVEASCCGLLPEEVNISASDLWKASTLR